MRWYFEVLRKYAIFGGRARRTEYWMFFLFNTLISIVLVFIERQVRIAPWITGVYSLLLIVPSCAVAVRRLHDTGKSWQRLLFVLLPVIGAVVLIIDFAQPSQAGNNKYGPRPEPPPITDVPLWSIAFILSILSVMLGFNLWLRGSAVAGIILTFGVPGVFIDLVASFEDRIRARVNRGRSYQA